MTSIAHSAATIQTNRQAVPATPKGFGEVALIAHETRDEVAARQLFLRAMWPAWRRSDARRATGGERVAARPLGCLPGREQLLVE